MAGGIIVEVSGRCWAFDTVERLSTDAAVELPDGSPNFDVWLSGLGCENSDCCAEFELDGFPNVPTGANGFGFDGGPG